MSAGLGLGGSALTWARTRVTGHRPEPPPPQPEPFEDFTGRTIRLRFDPALDQLAELTKRMSPWQAARQLFAATDGNQEQQ